MKVLSVARKTLIEYLREPLLLGLLFAFPIMMLGFYDIAFGETDQGLAKYLQVWVLNQDSGEMGAQLVSLMQEVEWEDRPVFEVTLVTQRRAAEIAVRERKISLLLVIPPDFSAALAAGGENHPPAVVSLVGYPASDNFVFAQSMLEGLVRWFTQYALKWESNLTVSYEFLPGTGTMSDFDFGVPGVIVFGIMFVAVTTAHTLVRENVSGTLRRLRLTRLRARDLLLGITLAQMVVALAMVPATFGAAALMGFRANGSLLLAMGIGLLLGLSAVGLGLLTACFARNDGEAANLSATVGMLMVLLSGAMYPMPDMTLVTVGGRAIQLYDLLPTTHAGEAMRRVLVLGEGVGDVGYELGGMVVLGGIILAASVALYQRLRLREA